MTELEMKQDDYPYYECPESWFKDINDMVDELYKLLSIYNLPKSELVFEQIKEKNGQIRVYITLVRQLEDLNDEEYIFYNCLSGIVEAIIQKYERLIKYKISNKLI